MLLAGFIAAPTVAAVGAGDERGRKVVAPSTAVLAKRLVKAVRAARTDPGRVAALRAMFKELGIGVTSRTGTTLVLSTGANSAARFHLYDFQLKALARQVKRNELRGTDQVATVLTNSGLEIAPGQPFPAALVGHSLRDAARAAKRQPTARNGLLVQIVRELGLARPSARQDITTINPDKLQLDPLQAWLVAADIQLGVLEKVPRAPAARRSAFGRAGALPDDCDRHNKFVEAAEKAREKAYGGKLGTAAVDAGVGYISDKVTAQLDRKGTRWAIRKLPRWATRGIWKGRKAAAVAGAVAEGLHGMMLAFSIKVEATDSMLEGHYGHGGPGEPLVFKLRVHSLDDYGALAAKCGKLAGKELPRAGGIEGVTMIWEQAERELSPLHGTVDCPGGATPCRSKTGADGVATLTFTPNAESGPPVGITREATGVLNGIALYQSALDSGLPGMVAQVITPKYDGTLWKLQYHHARGMRIQSNWHWARDTEETRGYHNGAIDIQVCGPDPYAAPWTGSMRLVGTDYNAGGAFDETQPVSVQFVRDAETGIGNAVLRVMAAPMWYPKTLGLRIHPSEARAELAMRLGYTEHFHWNFGTYMTIPDVTFHEAVSCPERP